MAIQFSEISEVLEELRQGRMIVLVDAEDRENEGDLVCAAEKVTPEIINFMARFGRGLICLPLTAEKCDSLGLYPQTADNTAPFGTAFTVSIDAAEGMSTGISAADRAQDDSGGHRRSCQTCRPRPSGSRLSAAGPRRRGAGSSRADRGSGGLDAPGGFKAGRRDMRGHERRRLHGPRAGAAAVLREARSQDRLDRPSSIEYRLQRESQIRRIECVSLPTDYGEFKLIGYESITSAEPHLALCKGGVGELDEKGQPIEHDEPVLVRVHSECMTGDLFHSQRCECGYQLITAMKMIEGTEKVP